MVILAPISFFLYVVGHSFVPQPRVLSRASGKQEVPDELNMEILRLGSGYSYKMYGYIKQSFIVIRLQLSR